MFGWLNRLGGKKHKANVSIDGFDRRWDYTTKDESREYAVIMDPNGQAGFINFTGAEIGDSRESRYMLECKEPKAEEEQQRKEADLKTNLQSMENQRRLNTLREAYMLAIQQKVERNWRKPSGDLNMPICEVHVVQGPGGIILDVSFGACRGSSARYRASIEKAVYKAEPLPKPVAPALFEQELTFMFNSN